MQNRSTVSSEDSSDIIPKLLTAKAWWIAKRKSFSIPAPFLASLSKYFWHCLYSTADYTDLSSDPVTAFHIHVELQTNSPVQWLSNSSLLHWVSTSTKHKHSSDLIFKGQAFPMFLLSSFHRYFLKGLLKLSGCI